jgi:hypothetical protein
VSGERKEEFRIFPGPMLSAKQIAASLRITPAEEDEVEFISPSIPGRRVRMISTESVEDDG